MNMWLLWLMRIWAEINRNNYWFLYFSLIKYIWIVIHMFLIAGRWLYMNEYSYVIFCVNFIWMSIHMNGCSYVLVYKVNYRTHLYRTIISNHYYFIIIHKATGWFTKKQHIIKHDRKCFNTVLLTHFLLS